MGTRERETQEGTEEKASMLEIMRERGGGGGRGQLEAAFPPRSLLGSGVTRKLAVFLTPIATKTNQNTRPHPVFLQLSAEAGGKFAF